MHSIRTKTSLFIALVLAASLAIVVAAAAYYVHVSAHSVLIGEIQTAASRQAQLIRAQLAEAQATARAIASVAESQLRVGRPDRSQLMEQLRRVLQREPTLFGTWLVMAPNAFDGRDAEWARRPGHDVNGMMNYYFIRSQGEVLLNLYDVTTDQSDQLQRDWFRIAFDSRREAIIEPYLETFDGAQGDQSVMMTSAAAPVFDTTGRPIGVAGVDLTLVEMQALVGPTRIAGSGEAALLSARGFVVAHPREEYLGRDAISVGYDADTVMAAALGGGRSDTLETPDGAIYQVVVPVDLGSAGQSWSYVFRIPVAAIEEGSRTLTRGLSLLGLGLIGAAIVAGLLVGSNLARPIQALTKAMRAIADGELDTEIPPARSRDEIGEMSQALAKFREAAIERAALETSMVDLKSYNKAVETLNDELRRHNARFDAALTNMSQGLCMLDSGFRLTVFNANFLTIFGLPKERVWHGMTMMEVVEAYGEIAGLDEEQIRRDVEGNYARLLSGRSSIVHQTLADGRIIEIAYEPMEGGGWVNTYEDVTERRTAEQRIAHLARHDPLTDLPNRTLFHERLEEALGGGKPVLMLYLDLDRFKPVNDTLGHHVGDELLKRVAIRIMEASGPGDTVARFGGDEFAVLRQDATPEDGADLARQILEAIGAPFTIEGNQINVGVSIGITLSEPGSDAGELLKEADLALYRAKADGRMTYRFFEASMDAAMRERRALEIDLRHAIDHDELSIHYQPIVSVVDGRIVACEALMRWRHPTRGNVSPMSFIPVAEEAGLIGALGRWALMRACREAVTWPEDVKVAVNFSAAQFCGTDIVALVREALAASRLAPQRLELEITESVLIQNSESVLRVLQELNGIGVSLAMDDFGTGYSSLAYLRRFPFQKIKIDQSFVADLPRSSESQAIVAAIVGLGATLDLVTTAEGVETEEQLLLLRAVGCVQAQGYLFSRPVPSEEIDFGRRARRATA